MSVGHPIDAHINDVCTFLDHIRLHELFSPDGRDKNIGLPRNCGKIMRMTVAHRYRRIGIQQQPRNRCTDQTAASRNDGMFPIGIAAHPFQQLHHAKRRRLQQTDEPRMKGANLHLAPRVTRHGVLVEVFGEGLLILGDSGVGKSETALELIKRGHRLVADDAVEIKRTQRNMLIGSAPELIRYYMELRGIGVINARQIYGVGAVKPENRIDLVVNMEPWEDGRAYDRLGLSTETTEILGVTLPMVTIPVRPGRNLAVIMELAAMNNRQKNMGYNAAETLAAEHDKNIDLGVGF